MQLGAVACDAHHCVVKPRGVCLPVSAPCRAEGLRYRQQVCRVAVLESLNWGKGGRRGGGVGGGGGERRTPTVAALLQPPVLLYPPPHRHGAEALDLCLTSILGREFGSIRQRPKLNVQVGWAVVGAVWGWAGGHAGFNAKALQCWSLVPTCKMKCCPALSSKRYNLSRSTRAPAPTAPPPLGICRFRCPRCPRTTSRTQR